jgi:metallo-beta-lactamase family protein
VHEVKIHGEYYPVKAHIEDIRTMSSHADQEGIIKWLSGITKRPDTIFINHGEPDASNALRLKIEKIFGWQVIIPQLEDQFQIG